jgi:hypothetical protein
MSSAGFGAKAGLVDARLAKYRTGLFADSERSSRLRHAEQLRKLSLKGFIVVFLL